MKHLKFEDALKRLEKITDKLETGDLSLEESLKLYQEGIKLKEWCYKYLQEAEGKIYKIIQSNDGKEILEEISEDSIFKNDLFS
jgi:exodeoxyribonuclease VII, small subunit